MSVAVTPGPLLTVQEVAERLRVNERTVRRKIASGEIPAIRRGEQRSLIRVDERELAAWLFRSREAGA